MKTGLCREKKGKVLQQDEGNWRRETEGEREKWQMLRRIHRQGNVTSQRQSRYEASVGEDEGPSKMSES